VVTQRAHAASTTLDACEGARLGAGGLEATFLHDCGMVGVSLLHEGEELLDRGAGLPAYRERGAVFGLPILHPWANRLQSFRYALLGREVELPHGPPLVHCEEHGLPIHGLLAASPYWRVTELGADGEAARLRARLDFAAHPELMAAFPFAHVLEMAATVTPRALTVTTTVQATGDVRVPVAFGYHPYLRLPGADRRDWIVTLPARRHLALDERGIPTGDAVPEPAVELTLGGRTFDDGYDALPDGAAFSVAGGGRRIVVTFERGYPVGQVFAPPARECICFEPMTAPANALCSDTELRTVAPGEALSAVFSIAVETA
jgi:galactose mutarotase-like enzyme